MVSNSRSTDLAKIHIAAKQLGINKDDGDESAGKLSSYQNMLWTVARVHSSADLDEAGRRKVLDHLKRCGFKAKPQKKRVAEYPGTPHNIAHDEQLHKIEALLADMKLPWSYADRIAKNVAGVARVAWVRESKHKQAIIAALTYEQEKRNLLVQVDSLLIQLGKDRSYIGNQVKHKNWTRHLPTLRKMVVALNNDKRRDA